jgi:hypothetical protein
MTVDKQQRGRRRRRRSNRLFCRSHPAHNHRRGGKKSWVLRCCILALDRHASRWAWVEKSNMELLLLLLLSSTAAAAAHRDALAEASAAVMDIIHRGIHGRSDDTSTFNLSAIAAHLSDTVPEDPTMGDYEPLRRHGTISSSFLISHSSSS